MSLVEAQMLISQIPAIPELREVAKTQWDASHHPQNLRDTYDAAKDVFKSSSLLTKILTLPFGVGLGGLEAYELSWKNENKIAEIATEGFVESGGVAIVEPARNVWEFSSKLEFGIAVLTTIALHKYRPALDVIRKRYFSEQDDTQGSVSNVLASPEEAEEVIPIENASVEKRKRRGPRPIKKTLRILGLSMTTGAFGVATIEDASRKKYSLTKNIGTGAVAGATIGSFNSGIAGGILWGIRTNTPYVSDALFNIGDGIKSPVVVGSVMGGMMLKKTMDERSRIHRKWEAEESAASRKYDEYIFVEDAAVVD